MAEVEWEYEGRPNWSDVVRWDKFDDPRIPRTLLINVSNQSCREYLDMTAQPSQTSRRCSLFSISTSSYRWPTIYRYANFSDRSSYRGSEERMPETRAEAAIRCYRRGRRLPLLWKKLRCTLVGIREKIMAIYYPEDWRSMLLTVLASKVTMAEAQCSEKRYCLLLFFSVHLLV